MTPAALPAIRPPPEILRFWSEHARSRHPTPALPADIQGCGRSHFQLPSDIDLDCFASLQVSANGELSNATSIAIAAPRPKRVLEPRNEPGYASQAERGWEDHVRRDDDRKNHARYRLSGNRRRAIQSVQRSRVDPALLRPEIRPLHGLRYHLCRDVSGCSGYASGCGNKTQVGAFSATATIPANFTIANVGSLGRIDRTQPLTLNWTSSGADTLVVQLNGTINGTSTHQVVVTCAVPASSGSLTIPAAALARLPVVPAGSTNAIGQISVTAGTGTSPAVSSQSSTAQTLTPPLVGGGQVDFGSFTAFLGYVKSVTIQ